MHKLIPNITKAVPIKVFVVRESKSTGMMKAIEFTTGTATLRGICPSCQ